MIKRPFTLLLATLALGIVCRGSYAYLTGLVVFSYAVLLVSLRLLPELERVVLKGSVIAVFAPFMFFLGMLLASKAERSYSIDLCLAQSKAGKVNASVTGKITDIAASKNGYKVTLGDAVITAEGDSFRGEKVLIYAESADLWKIGNVITAKGTAREFGVAENPGQFDEKAYYRAKQYSCKFNIDYFEFVSENRSVFSEAVRRFREHLSAIYDALFPEEEAGIVKSLILGDKSTLSDDTRELYRKNGIVHILAISGLHISLIGSGIFAIMRRAGCSLIPASAVTSGVLVAYGILTGFPVSVIRAVFMLIYGMIAKAAGRSADMGESCALCGIIVLICSPLMLFQASFMLSFAAAVGIGFFGREFAKWEKTKERSVVSGILNAVLATLAPQLATIPVIWFYYYEIPVYSVFVNMLILPAMSLLVVLAAIAGLFAFVSLKLAVFPAGGVYFLLKGYSFLCKLMLKLPKPLILYGRPERIRMLLCYGLIAAFFVIAALIGRKYGYGEKSLKMRPRAALILLFIPLVFIRIPGEGLNISFLSVGQGDCCVMQVSAKSAVMVDCGSAFTSNIARYRLEPFLKYSGIDTLEAIFVTHPDKDHFSGVEELLGMIDNDSEYRGTVRVKRLIVTPETAKEPKMEHILELALEKNVQIITFLAGDRIEIEGLSLYCVSPSEKADTADNEGSIVLVAKYRNFDAVLMGDAAYAAERAVLAAAEEGLFTLPADILKVAHHGSKNNNSESFINTLKPAVAVISYGRGNTYGHPHAIVTERLENAGCIIYGTGRSGAACFKVK